LASGREIIKVAGVINDQHNWQSITPVPQRLS